MLDANEKRVLKEMLEEVRAMMGKESTLIFGTGRGRIPEKSLTQLNLMYMLPLCMMLERLIELNEGEFARFVEMWPRIWGRLFETDPPWNDKLFPEQEPFVRVVSPFERAIRWSEDLMIQEMLKKGVKL